MPRRRFSAVAEPVDPTIYAGNTLWLTSQAGVVYTDGNASSITSQGPDGLVYNDSAAPSRRPTPGAVYQGFPSLRFDGVGNQLTQTTGDIGTLVNATAFTLVAVVAWLAFTQPGSYGGNADINTLLADNTEYLVFGGDTSGGGSAVIAPYSAGYVPKKIATPTGTLCVLSARLGGGVLRLSRNGVEAASVACGAITSLGGVVSLGRGSSYYGNFDFCELAAFDLDHTGADNTALVAAYMTKYGVT